MEKIIKKATGVLERMVENLDEESLDRTRQTMCTPEEYTDYLVDAFDTGKITMQEAIKRAMKYGALNSLKTEAEDEKD